MDASSAPPAGNPSRGAAVAPPRLGPGDLVAVCTPSGSVPSRGRLERGVERLRAMGFEVRVGPLATSLAPRHTAAARADELNAMIADPEVRAVFGAIGGYCANGVVELIDYASLRRDPKAIVGYSDLTCLLVAAYTQASLVTFHGPTVLPELGEHPAPPSYTSDSMASALTEPRPMGVLTAPQEWTEEYLAWDVDDHRPRTYRPHPGWSWAGSGGVAVGPLVGGNLDTLCALAGTPYFPDLHGAAFFWETVATNLDVVERDLTHLELTGALDRVAGMIVGRPFRAGPEFEAAFEALVVERFGARGFPVVTGVDIGHTDPMLTLPLGCRAQLDGAARTIEVLDAAVR